MSKFIEVKEIIFEKGKEYNRANYPSDGVYIVDVDGHKTLYCVSLNCVTWIGNLGWYTFVDFPTPYKKVKGHNERGEEGMKI